MISLSAVLLGLINIAVVVIIFVLIGAVALWIMGALGWPIPPLIQRLYMGIVALIALYMLVALLLGVPSIHLLGHVSY